MTLPITGTGTSGMEAGIAALIDPGATAIIGVNGYFGRAARRDRAPLRRPRGRGARPTGARRSTTTRCSPRWPSTRGPACSRSSTPRRPPGCATTSPSSARRCAGSSTFLMADCVTSLGGIEVALSGWGVDYAYSCTQKCLAMPPGMSPVSLSQRALDWVHEHPRPVTFYLDLAAARAVLAAAAAGLPPHASGPAGLRPARGRPPRAGGGHGRALGAPRRGGRPLPGGDDRARVAPPRRPRPPAAAAHGGPRARRASTAPTCSGACCASTASRSAAGSRRRRRCGGSA